MVWHNLDRIYHKVIGLQTSYGKFWYINMVFFRLFTLLVVAEELYETDFDFFRCDTGQPGCSNVCFNLFSPINHERFWGFQILFCSIPIVVYHSWALEKIRLFVDKFNQNLGGGKQSGSENLGDSLPLGRSKQEQESLSSSSRTDSTILTVKDGKNFKVATGPVYWVGFDIFIAVS